MRNNLSAMIKQSQAANIRLLLIGMKIPPNYGKKYTQDFSDTYPLLANQHAVKLVPFFLEGIAGQRNLIQDDGLHPLAIAQPQLLNNVWPMLNSMMSH
jgi:acyl-CoA thioesterase-1